MKSVINENIIYSLVLFPSQKALTAVKSAMRLRRLSSLGSNLRKAALEHTAGEQASPSSSPVTPDTASSTGSDVFSENNTTKYGNLLSPTSCETIVESINEEGAVGGAGSETGRRSGAWNTNRH